MNGQLQTQTTTLGLRNEAKELVPYLNEVRRTIQGLDGLVMGTFERGAALVLALLVAPWAFFEKATKEGHLFSWAPFWLSMATVFVAAFIVITVSLYADLLRRAVQVGLQVEAAVLMGPQDCHLTTWLDRSFFAAGRHGRILYLVPSYLLLIGVSVISVIYLHKCDPAPARCWLIAYIAFVTFIFVVSFLCTVPTWTTGATKCRN